MVETLRKKELIALSAWFVLALAFGWSRQTAAWGIISISFWVFSAPALRGCRAPAHPAMLWLGWTLFALPFSGEPLKSIWTVSHYAVFAGVYFTAATLACGGRDILRRSAHIAAYVVALVVIAVHFMPGMQKVVFPGALINWAAAFAAAACAGSFAIAGDSSYPSKKRIGAGVCSAVALLAVWFSHSRGAMLGCVAGAGLAFVFRRDWKALRYFAFALVLCALALFVPMRNLIVKPSDPFSFSRLHIWGVALSVIAHNPLTGIGAGCYERGYLLLNTAYRTGLSQYGRYALDAHSQILNMAAENGILAAVFFAVLSLAALARGFEDNDYVRPMAMAGAIFAQSCVDGIMQCAPLCIMYFALLGGTEKSGEQNGAGRAAVPGWTALGLPLCTCALIVASCGAGARERDDAGALFSSARAALAAPVPNPYLAVARLDRAAELFPGSALYVYQRGKILDRLGLTARASADYRKAAELEPVFAAPEASLAFLDGRLGMRADARSALAEAASRVKMCAAAPRESFDPDLCSIPEDMTNAAALSGDTDSRVRNNMK